MCWAKIQKQVDMQVKYKNVAVFLSARNLHSALLSLTVSLKFTQATLVAMHGSYRQLPNRQSW